MNDLTLVSCSFNTPEVTLTMLRSFVAHHGRGPHRLILMENSTDPETAERLDAEGIPYIRQVGERHSPSVDVALPLVETTLALLVDTDIVFHRAVDPVVHVCTERGLTLLGHVCGDRGGYRLHPRVHPWFCLLRADHLRTHAIRFHDDERIQRTGSDGFYGSVPVQEPRGGVRLYDVGATMYEDVDAAGLTIGHAEMEGRFFSHYEGSSWQRQVSDDVYTALGERVADAFRFDQLRYRDVSLQGAFVAGFTTKDEGSWPSTVRTGSSGSAPTF